MSRTAQEHKADAPSSLGFAVIICSSSRYETLKKGYDVEDPSGDLIVHLVQKQGYSIIQRKIIPDDVKVLMKTVQEALVTSKVDVIITCGGTGISHTDITVETIQSVLERELPGFGEIFRMISYQEIGSSAILTRAIAGISKNKVIFCIPGSIQAVSISMKKLILPEVSHIIRHVVRN